MNDDEKHPWPGKFEDLFSVATAPDANWVFNACMDGWPTIHKYAFGYRTGAELLFKYLKATGERQHNDVVVYPIIFCWRQYLELTLKLTVMMVRALTGTVGAARLDKHDLSGLWNELEPHLLALDAKPAEVESVGQAVKYLNDYDPDSFAFRYPTTKTGASTQSSIPTHINLLKLNDIMEGVANWLDAGIDVVGERIDWEAEAETEARANMDGE